MRSVILFVGKMSYVFSRTPHAATHPEVTWVHEEPAGYVRRLRAQEGKDIWLIGGRVLFNHLLHAGLVDELMPAVHPRILGEGIPLFQAKTPAIPLEFLESTPYPTGLVTLRYRVLTAAS